jgi:hypothetical protein
MFRIKEITMKNDIDLLYENLQNLEIGLNGNKLSLAKKVTGKLPRRSLSKTLAMKTIWFILMSLNPAELFMPLCN